MFLQVSLKQAHLQPTATAGGLVQSHAPSEEVLWAYLVQLTSGLRAAHSADLVCRRASLHPSKARPCPASCMPSDVPPIAPWSAMLAFSSEDGSGNGTRGVQCS